MRKLILLNLIILTYAPILIASEPFRPFVGVDFQERILPFEQHAGGSLLRDRAFQYDLYGGIRHGCWGLALGYLANKNKNRTTEWVPANTLQVETHYSEIKIKGPHADLLGFYPLSSHHGVELLGGIGITYSKLTLVESIVALDNVFLLDPLRHSYNTQKLNARILGGIQCLVYERIGIRATLTWENTNVFKNLLPHESLAPSALQLSAKNSWAYGIGWYAG